MRTQNDDQFYLDTPEAADALASQLNDILYEVFIANKGYKINAGAKNEAEKRKLFISIGTLVQISGLVFSQNILRDILNKSEEAQTAIRNAGIDFVPLSVSQSQTEDELTRHGPRAERAASIAASQPAPPEPPSVAASQPVPPEPPSVDMFPTSDPAFLDPTMEGTLNSVHTEQGVMAAVQIIHTIATTPDSREDAAYEAAAAIFLPVKGESTEGRNALLEELREIKGKATKESFAEVTGEFLERHSGQSEQPLTTADLGYASKVLLEGCQGNVSNRFTQGIPNGTILTLIKDLANRTTLPEEGKARDCVELMRSASETNIHQVFTNGMWELSDMALAQTPKVFRC